jgi:hypothetical protein
MAYGLRRVHPRRGLVGMGEPFKLVTLPGNFHPKDIFGIEPSGGAKLAGLKPH